eukprot:TRINITY_DN13081_c0_g1_i1.p1 TRINITY_DN13081_c0_g1~~TRINITY_DN13081_c0_g1_i1.p1  ORF type:complete len:639 (-),score=42.95 TRINITY_DN13081_c0_g1_i1:3-1919(-)
MDPNEQAPYISYEASSDGLHGYKYDERREGPKDFGEGSQYTTPTKSAPPRSRSPDKYSPHPHSPYPYSPHAHAHAHAHPPPYPYAYGHGPPMYPYPPYPMHHYPPVPPHGYPPPRHAGSHWGGNRSPHHYSPGELPLREDIEGRGPPDDGRQRKRPREEEMPYSPSRRQKQIHGANDAHECVKYEGEMDTESDEVRKPSMSNQVRGSQDRGVPNLQPDGYRRDGYEPRRESMGSGPDHPSLRGSQDRQNTLLEYHRSHEGRRDSLGGSHDNRRDSIGNHDVRRDSLGGPPHDIRRDSLGNGPHREGIGGPLPHDIRRDIGSGPPHRDGLGGLVPHDVRRDNLNGIHDVRRDSLGGPTHDVRRDSLGSSHDRRDSLGPHEIRRDSLGAHDNRRDSLGAGSDNPLLRASIDRGNERRDSQSENNLRISISAPTGSMTNLSNSSGTKASQHNLTLSLLGVRGATKRTEELVVSVNKYWSNLELGRNQLTKIRRERLQIDKQENAVEFELIKTEYKMEQANRRLGVILADIEEIDHQITSLLEEGVFPSSIWHMEASQRPVPNPQTQPQSQLSQSQTPTLPSQLSQSQSQSNSQSQPQLQSQSSQQQSQLQLQSQTLPPQLSPQAQPQQLATQSQFPAHQDK